MPSAAMKRSISDNKLCEAGTRHSRSKSISVLPQAASSSRSASAKKAWWRQLFMRTERSSWPRHSDLTKEKVLDQAPSPDRESHTTVGSLSSIISLIQNWKCLISKGNNEYDSHGQNTAGAGVKKAATSLMKTAGESRLADVVKKEENRVLRSSVLGNSGQSDKTFVEKKPQRERVPPSLVATNPSQTLMEGDRDAVVIDNGIVEEWNTVKYVWADKHRPAALESFICNRNKASTLRTLAANSPGCGHLIFEGPPGVGKTTMIRAFIREVTRLPVLQVKEIIREFDLKGESIGSIPVNVRESDHHIELNLSELRGYEKNVIVQLIKERHTKCSKSTYAGHGNCKAIVLYEADQLSSDTLLYIRWLLERFKGFTKVFFCCSDVSKLQLIKGLCTHIELLPPSNEEIVQVLELIAKHEGLELPYGMANKIAVRSKNNLRQAIRSLEATWRYKYPFEGDQDIKNGWEDNIVGIAKFIMEEQSPRQLYKIRRMLQYLIEHNVAADYLFKTLAGELGKLVEAHLKPQIEALYNDYSRDDCCMPHHDKSTPVRLDGMVKKLHKRKKKGQEFMKIEEFIAKFMSMYKASMSTPSPSTATT